jgi:hypothetical protein
MPNPNYQFSGMGEMMITDPIEGQQVAALYDPLRQSALVPDLRQGADGRPSITMPYPDMGFEGMLSQMYAQISGGAERTVKARDFYFAEYDQHESLAFAVKGGSTTTPGTTTATTISRLSQTQNGLFVKPIAGYKAILKEANRQIVTINTVTQVSPGNWNITLGSINGETIDLTGRSRWTLILFPVRDYVKGTNNPIQKRGFVYNPPILYKGHIQKFEDGISIKEDELDNFVYNLRWEMVKGFDRNGNAVNYFYMPALTDRFVQSYAANRTLKALFNQRDHAAQDGFDGIIPTIDKYGMFNMSYSSLLHESFSDLLFSMIKSIRKVSGSPEYLMLHDFNFGLDWSNAMNTLVKSTDAGDRYRSFGDGAVGERTLEYFQFTNFNYGPYMFRATQIDMYDSPRYGNVLEYFAMLLPGKKLRDSDGNTVPIVTFVNLEGVEPAKRRYIWFDDARVRGERELVGYMKDHFGLEIHAPTRCGLIFNGDK